MLTTNQAAEKIGVKTVTIRSYLRRGLFPSAVKFGRDWQIHEADVESFVAPKAGKPSKKNNF